ncbi:hypothetical protein ACFX1X_020495 [Malus domestica]
MDSTTSEGASSFSSSSTSFTHPSSSSTSFTHPWRYDVFLSFRGEDTRYHFVGHLYNYLVQMGIKTFMDEKSLKRGEEISLALLKAIEDSRISLVVFSENYASSRWCLDELVHIFHCKEQQQQMVFPVFFKVDPSEVRNQRESFGKALADHESKLKDNMDKVLRWRETLTKAANLSGWSFLADGHEYKFIQKIVKGISDRVFESTHLKGVKYPVGIESRVKQSSSVFLDPPVLDRKQLALQRREGQTEDQKRHQHHFVSSLALPNRSSDAAPPATTANSDQDRDRDRERDRDRDRDRSPSKAQDCRQLETQIRRKVWFQIGKKTTLIVLVFTVLFIIIALLLLVVKTEK